MLMLRSCHKHCEDLSTQLKELGAIVKEHYFDHVSKILCERLDTVVNENTFAMRNAETNRIGAVTLHAHVTSLRFAHLVTSMYTIMNAERSEIVVNAIKNGMQKLCDSTRTLLGRLSESHSQRHERAVFLVNNIDKILTVFREGDVNLRWMNVMQELMEKQIHNYVDSLLLSKFGMLMTKFGGSGSSGLNSSDEKKKDINLRSSVSDKDLQRIASEFSRTYKSTIKQFDAIVIKSFQNAALAITVAKRLFKVLLMTYPRFHTAVKTRFDNSRDRPSWLRDVVGTGAVMVEVKRYHRLV